MTFGKFVKAAVAAASVLVLAGCAGLTESREQVAKDSADGRRYADAMAQPTSSLPSNIRTRPRIAGDAIVRDRNAMPKVLQQDFSYKTNAGQSLSQVAQNLSTQLGMQVRVLQTVGGAGGANAAGAQRRDTGDLMVLDWRQKPVTGLLDLIAQQQGLFWRYSPERGVEFFEFESRTFHVNVPSGVKRVDATISLGSGGGGSAGGSAGGASGGSGGSGGGGSVNIASSTDIDPYTGMMNSISAMLAADEGDTSARASSGGGGAGARSGGGSAGGAGGASGGAGAGASAGGASSGGSASRGNSRMIASPELGIITVTARPPTLERVATFVEAVNRRYAQNVQIDLSVYSVKISRQNQVGFSADVIFRNLANQGVNLVGAPILAPQTGVPSQMTIEAGNGRFAGSKLVTQALSGLGDVSLVTTGHVMAINGQPSPFQVADQITYLASSSTTTSPNVGATTSLQPGKETAGFTGNFLPLILSDNRILLQYQLQLSSVTLSSVSSGNATIQTPLKSEQSLQQQAYVRDGQAIVLMSFEQRRGADDRQLGLLSASTAVNSDRNLLVVVMQVSTRGTGGERG